MKKTFNLVVFSLLLHSAALYAQPTRANDPGEGSSGKVMLIDNSIISGTIKDNIRRKGEVTLLTGEEKTKYKAGDISGVEIGGTRYITWNYTFYEVVFAGKNLTLLRKANEPAAVQYNGPNAVTVTSEGRVDDLFVKKNNDASPQLLTKKTAKEVLGKICSSCASIDESRLDEAGLKKAVTDCDNCQ